MRHQAILETESETESWLLQQHSYYYFLHFSLSHTEISEKFGVRCHFLQALLIRQSLPLEWRRVIRSEYSYKPVREPFINHNGAVLQLDKCTTKFIYECYVQMKYVTPRVYWNGKRYM